MWIDQRKATAPLIGQWLRRAGTPPTTDRLHHRALSLVDALVAAVAESRSLTVLHYDADFELVSRITGQPTQWVVEPDTAD